MEARRLWAKIRVASRDVLTEEQQVPLLAQRQPPTDTDALVDLRDGLKGFFSSQSARGHIERIRAWEGRVRQAWISKPSDVYRLVRTSSRAHPFSAKGRWYPHRELGGDAGAGTGSVDVSGLLQSGATQS